MFKRFVLSTVLLVFVGVLGACGSNEGSSSSEPKEEAKPAEQKEVSNKPSEPTKDENGDYVLEEVGQKATTEGATAELLKIKPVNETINIAPIKVTVKDIKVIKLTDLSEDMRNGLTLYDIKVNEGDELNYVQVQFQAENTEEKNIEWYDLMNVVTDKGEQIDGQLSDFISDDADVDSQYLGKVKKDFTDGFVVKNADINKVKLVFGSTIDSDSYEDITKEQQVEYSFK